MKPSISHRELVRHTYTFLLVLFMILFHSILALSRLLLLLFHILPGYRTMTWLICAMISFLFCRWMNEWRKKTQYALPQNEHWANTIKIKVFFLKINLNQLLDFESSSESESCSSYVLCSERIIANNKDLLFSLLFFQHKALNTEHGESIKLIIFNETWKTK